MADLSVDAPLLTGRSPPLTINGKVAVIAAERSCWAEQQICRPPFHRRRKRIGYSQTFCAFHFIMIMRCLDSHSYSCDGRNDHQNTQQRFTKRPRPPEWRGERFIDPAGIFRGRPQLNRFIMVHSLGRGGHVIGALHVRLQLTCGSNS
jgi:hypothetical protein